MLAEWRPDGAGCWQDGDKSAARAWQEHAKNAPRTRLYGGKAQDGSDKAISRTTHKYVNKGREAGRKKGA
ncbi:hypothetical protein [Shewanella jiangmenensis]|nr:hypothetical protein [Shewanella jiangmenensis]